MSVEQLQRPGSVAARPQAQESAASGVSIFSGETVALAVVLSTALITHAFNMFNFPLYRQDEGIVSQQAWSLLNNWQLSPYTYTYEHPPLATYMLAVWTFVTGGFHTFGASINSGRVLMVALHLGSCFFLFRTVRQLSGSLNGGAVAGLLFSLSPLAVGYQRLVVVDNFMVFWLLATLYFLVCNRGRMFYFFLASLTLGFAIATMEIAVIFVPAFLILTWRFADPYHRLYAFWGSALIGFVVSFQYVLYAIFKSELVPDNLDFAGELEGRATHVSLLGTLYQNYYQAKPLWEDNQAFPVIWQQWMGLDSFLLYAGLICAGINLLFGFKYKENWVVPLLGLSYGLFIALGGVQADYMAVAIVPFLALAVGQTVGWTARLIGGKFAFVVAAAIALGGGFFYISNNQSIYTARQNEAYLQVLNWIKTNIPADRSMVISDALWVDLHDNFNGPMYPNAHSHWKAAGDPAVRYNIFRGDYRNVDYLLVTSEMREQLVGFTRQVLDNSSLVRMFGGPDALEVRKVNNDKPLIEAHTLENGYAFFKSSFVGLDGKVVDGSGRSSLDQQLAAMQLALWNNDQRTFDMAWIWTAYNLQMDNNLFRADSTLSVARSRNLSGAYNNTRADSELALALLLAGQRWKDASYTREAQYIVKSIWDNAVVELNKSYYLKATVAPQAHLEDQILLNIGAFAPQAYRFFAEVDKEHNWMGLYHNGYALLRKAAWYGRGDYKGVGLPPGLVVMSLENEELRAVNGTFGTRLGDFDQEAQHAMWNVLLDYEWFKSQSAREYIETTSWFLVKYWQKWQSLAGQYTNNGLPVAANENLSTYAIGSAGASILDEIELAKKRAQGRPANLDRSSIETEMVARAFMGSFFRKDGQGYWLRKDDFDAQYWGWLGSAMHMNRLSLNFEQPEPTK